LEEGIVPWRKLVDLHWIGAQSGIEESVQRHKSFSAFRVKIFVALRIDYRQATELVGHVLKSEEST
jgi:hypothetical protein